MTRKLLLAALALACLAVSLVLPPAVLAAETATAGAEPVTWGALGAILGWVGLSLLAFLGLGIATLVVGGIILKAWSH